MTGGRGSLTGTILGVMLLAFWCRTDAIEHFLLGIRFFSGVIILISISSTAWNEKRKLAKDVT